MVVLFDIEYLFHLLIHHDDHRAERYIHQIVDAEASIKGNDSLVLVHQPH